MGQSASTDEKYQQPSPGTYSEYKTADEKGDKFWVTEADAVRPIVMGKEYPANLEPRIVMDVFKQAVDSHSNLAALRVERGPQMEWRVWTWKQWYDDVMTFAQALVKLDVKPFRAVSIIGFNSPEWLIGDLGCIAAQCMVAGIYTTNGPEACAYIVSHSESEVVVCENTKQLDKFMAVKDTMPTVKAYVVWDEDADLAQDKYQPSSDDKFKVYSWVDFMKLGAGDDKDKLKAEVDGRIAATKPGHCCTLIYTSGTTGNPKAVMISNDNCTWTAHVLMNSVPGSYTEVERGVSYLPLSHVAAQLNDIHLVLDSGAYGKGATVYFARPDALKGTLKLTLGVCRPTFFFGVPRVWEKFAEAMQAKGASTTGLKKTIAEWAKAKGKARRDENIVGGSHSDPFGYGIANSLVFSPVKEALGLDKCRMFVTGAAPIQKATLDYFAQLDIWINEVYGMSESTGPQNITTPRWMVPGSVGTPLPGCEIKLFPAAGFKDDEGEIAFRGRHIMMGYLKNNEKTQEAIDPDGWLHSGDVGRIDPRTGSLFITGRIKELIIGAGGENIAPVIAEDMVKLELPGLSNVMMVGDKRKYCVCLVTLRQQPDEKTDGAFTDVLVGESAKVSEASKTVTEAIKDPVWKKYIFDGIVRANKKAVSNAAKIQKFRIVPQDFSVPGGDLTATLKLKRSVVAEKYKDLIEDMYNSKE